MLQQSDNDDSPLSPDSGEDERRWTISELSEEFAVTPRALRFYEEEGLIFPVRQGLARVYSRRDRARLAWIIRAKSVGFALSEIREMIDLYDLGDGRVEQRRVAVAKSRERIAMLARQRDEIDATIRELEEFVVRAEALALPKRRRGA